MSFPRRPHSRDDTAFRPSSAVQSRCTTVVTIAAAAALMLTGLWAARTPVLEGAAPLPVVTAAAGVMALAVRAFLLFRATRRCRARTAATLASIERLHLCSLPAHVVGAQRANATVAVDILEHPRVRALQLHVRTLETALEEQSARLAQAQRDIGRQRERDMDRVLVTLGALRNRISGDPRSESVFNRLEAAVVRLAPARAPDRPALPAPLTATPSPPPVLSPTPTTPAAPAAQASRSAADAWSAAEQLTSTPNPEVTRDTVASVSDETVLPVPAPACEAAPPGKRWRRRSAA
jgi:hypothetical protein